MGGTFVTKEVLLHESKVRKKKVCGCPARMLGIAITHHTLKLDKPLLPVSCLKDTESDNPVLGRDDFLYAPDTFIRVGAQPGVIAGMGKNPPLMVRGGDRRKRKLQALLDGINQSQSSLFPDYRHLNPTSQNQIRQLRLVVFDHSSSSPRRLLASIQRLFLLYSDGPATSAHYRTGLTPMSRSAGS
ncbi:hypothetical protein VNO80_03214 [Phaseolus coccineus]|uniref:Uncharacterized protein n=1 Tax=Phaseolus coccineus TaxID=3886 RepID=A0AAN9NVL5_PHACN